MSKKQLIYLDNAATTPVDSAVFKKMQPYFCKEYGNPSTIYSLGEEASSVVEQARLKIAGFFNCLPEEIYFTSSATESDNWIINGVIEKLDLGKSAKPHLIVSSIEHKAILEPCRVLFKKGKIELTLLPVDSDGLVQVKDVKESIRKNTCLVSIMYANSEIGSIQPIQEIGQLIREVNKNRKEPIIFHTDAVQAINYLNCQVDYLNVDSLSLSGHKIYGPKGIGALYIRKGTRISPFIRGGGQERKMRSGTENVAGIVGLAEAIEKVRKSRAKNKSIEKLRDKLIKGVLESIVNSKVNGSLKKRLPSNAHFSFKGAEGEGIVVDLSQKGICASTGSACASGSLSPSQTLLAIGLSQKQAHSSIRFTLGRQTTNMDINYTLKVLPEVISRLRKISGR